MSSTFFDIKGVGIPIEDLSISRACSFAFDVTGFDYVNLIECIKLSDEAEAVVIDVEVELGQKQSHEIRKTERIAIQFASSDDCMPEVLALRMDFPLVPHINLRSNEIPRSLCLYDKSFEEIKLDWTSVAFIERIREWLSKTAKGTLHAKDQPLEPILMSTAGDLILPNDTIQDSDIVQIARIDEMNKRWTLIAKVVTSYNKADSPSFIALPITTEPQIHGIIRRTPMNLKDLHDLLEVGNIDFLELLNSKLEQWVSDKNILNAKLIIIVSLPKKRSDSSTTESIENRAFMIFDSIKDIGIKTDKWDTSLGRIMRKDPNKNGSDVQLHVLNTMKSFSSEIGKDLNSVITNTKRRIAFIGAGALGSQVILNMARMGYNNWTIIDNDIFLPHNLARHVLLGTFVGFQKSKSMAYVVSCLLNDNDAAKGYSVDISKQNTDEDEYSETLDALKNAEIIIDSTTSIAFSRYLASNDEFSARRISIFLNPAGTALVILAEKADRSIKLDSIEMQYYRYLINTTELETHLQMPETHRYANSCSDISSKIEHNSIAMQAAICSNTLGKLMDDNGPALLIWDVSLDDYSLKHYKVDVNDTLSEKVNEWTLCYDTAFIEKIFEARLSKLPNETGGIIIGSYDMFRKIIYLVDTILSPGDSVEWPTVYIRGHRYLTKQIKYINEVTQERLTYIGEWHSHPSGCDCSPSSNDKKALGWQSKYMEDSGYPALMLIAGDNSNYAFLVAEI